MFTLCDCPPIAKNKSEMASWDDEFIVCRAIHPKTGKECGAFRWEDFCQVCDDAFEYPCFELVDDTKQCGQMRNSRWCTACLRRGVKPKESPMAPIFTERDPIMPAWKVDEMKRELRASLHRSIRPKVDTVVEEWKRDKQWPGKKVLSLRQESNEIRAVENLKKMLHMSVHSLVDQRKRDGKLFSKSNHEACVYDTKVLGELMERSQHVQVAKLKAKLSSRLWPKVDELRKKGKLFDDEGRLCADLF